MESLISNNDQHLSTETSFRQSDTPILTLDDKRIQEFDYDSKTEKSALTLFGYRGQAKLLFSSIQFLTAFFSGMLGPVDPAYTIIYVGAAPGLSILVLDKLFHKYISAWIMYDPEGFAGKFCEELCRMSKNNPDRFKIFREYFTNDVARSLARSCDPDRTIILFDQRTDDKSSKKMTEDFQLTCETLKIIRPAAAWAKLRFRWPKNDDDVELGIGGTIYVQPWTAQFSAECRLFITRDDIDAYIDGKVTKYNLRQFERRMFGYNLEARWMNQIKTNCIIKGFDQGNDSQLSLYIAKQFLYLQNSQMPTVQEVHNFIIQCDKDLREIGGRHLQSFLDTPVGICPGMPPKARIAKKDVKAAILIEKGIARKKKTRSHSPTSKTCRKCKAKFTSRNPRHNYCKLCSDAYNRKK
jgi:hypothetical protein